MRERMATRSRRLFEFLAAAFLAGCAGARGQTTASGEADLVRVPSSRVDVLSIAPGASIGLYGKLLVDPVGVTYERDWNLRHPEVDTKNAAKLRGFVSASFTDVLVHELQRPSAYTIVSEPGADVLRVHAQIVDLDIAAPSLPAPVNKNRYVLSAGEMTLLLELYDSRTGALLARAVDRKRGRETGTLQIANADTNAADLRRAFAAWAAALRDGLDAARAEPATKGPRSSEAPPSGAK